LIDFVSYWNAKRSGARLPARADIDPMDLKPFLGDLFMLDVVGAPKRFRYRLIGTRIVAAGGRDSTGKYLEDVFGAERATVENAFYQAICLHRTPMRTSGVLDWRDREFRKYEIAYVPIAEDGMTVDIIVGCMSIDHAGG